jgi:hypothetical protein
MTVNLQFSVKPGDLFRYQSSFTTLDRGRKTTNTAQSAERVVGAGDGLVQIVQPEDPDALVMVYDRRGYPTDILQNGVSIKNEVPGEAFDISNRLIFPDRPVNPGDTWEADDGVVHVSFRLIGTGALKGREAAEVHATTDGYYGPIRYWVELASGRLLRQEYMVGGPNSGTTTVTERT